MHLRNLSILLFLLFSVQAFGFDHCGLVKKRSLAYKSTSRKANGVILNKNIIVPIIGEEGEFHKIQFLGEEYFLKKGQLRKGSNKLCSMEYKCFKLERPSAVFLFPTQKSKRIRVHKANEELPWVATTRTSSLTGKKGWFQVVSEGEYVWVPSQSGKFSEESCVKEEGKRNLYVAADYGYTLSSSASNYSYLITSVPDPTSVACLQNPIVSQIESGQGHRVGLNVIYGIMSWLSLGVGVDFESIRYQVKTLDNPHPDPGNTNCALIDVDISSLQSGSFTIEEQNVVVPVSLIFPFRLSRNHHIFLSGNVNSVFNLDKQQSFEFFTGQTLSKQTLNSQEIGVNSFRTNYGVELKYIYSLPLDSKDTMGISISTKKLSDAFSVGIGIIL